MKTAAKYLLITIGGLILLGCAALVVIPIIADVEKYKPKIEQLVTERTGYPLVLDGDIDLSLFPWFGLSFSDLKLNNPEGFTQDRFLEVKNFQAQLKVIPLLSKKVEIRRFIIDQPEMYLEKNAAGRWNWQQPIPSDTGKKSSTAGKQEKSAEDKKPAAPDETSKIPALQSLLVGKFAVSNGKIVVIDHPSATRRELSSLNLNLTDVSLNKPILIDFQAQLDGKPLSIQGSVGPLTADPLTNPLKLDIGSDIFETLNITIKGMVEHLDSSPRYELDFNVSPFNPKDLFSKLKLDFPVTPADPTALESLMFNGKIAGSTKDVTLSGVNIVLDDSAISSMLSVKEFSTPDITLQVAVDSIELDRYLPKKQTDDSSASTSQKTPPDHNKKQRPEPGTSGDSSPTTAQAPSRSNTAAQDQSSDNQVGKPGSEAKFEQLRKLILMAEVTAGTVKVHGGTISNIKMNVDGKDGLFTLSSLDCKLYRGSIKATGTFDVSKSIPGSSLTLDIQKIQAGPLLQDFAEKNIIEGTLNGKLRISTSGTAPDQIKKSLNGNGNLLFEDGAIIGIDLAQLARNIKSGFTLGQQTERMKTDFAELHVPFTISDGLFNTEDTSLKSPFIRVNGQGDVNLVDELLDLRLQPKLVGTIKGQGDKETYSGISVPIIVGGSFDKPTFTPDLEALVKEQGIDQEEISEILKTGTITPERKEQLSEEVEKAKGLLKGLFGN